MGEVYAASINNVEEYSPMKRGLKEGEADGGLAGGDR
jgi:hypothetical protein